MHSLVLVVEVCMLYRWCYKTHSEIFFIAQYIQASSIVYHYTVHSVWCAGIPGESCHTNTPAPCCYSWFYSHLVQILSPLSLSTYLMVRVTANCHLCSYLLSLFKQVLFRLLSKPACASHFSLLILVRLPMPTLSILSSVHLQL